MGKFLLLAFRNVFRNRRRTIMTLIMVGGGVAGLLLVGASLPACSGACARAQSTTASATSRYSPLNTLTAKRSMFSIPASTTGGRCGNGFHRRPCARRRASHRVLRNAFERREIRVFMGSAVDPVAESSLGFSPRLAAGRDLDSKPSGETEALIGIGVARSMNVKPGDGLTLLAVTSDGALNGIDVQIVGLVNTGFKEVDDRYLRITLPSAQRLLQSDRVTNLVVGLDKTENTDMVAAELAPRLRGLPQQLVLKKWIDLAAYYKQVRSLFSTIFVFLGVIVFSWFSCPV